MSSVGKIRKLFARSGVTVPSNVDDRIVGDALATLDKSAEAGLASPGPRRWRVAVFNGRASWAAAAVLVVAALIGLRAFDNTTAWADVVKAINDADNIHVVSRITLASGEVREHHAWLKNGNKIYEENPGQITIDDGETRLTLDREKKTAQLSDSHWPFEDYMETGHLEIMLLFRGEDTPFKATPLPDQQSAAERVFDISYRDSWKGKAWVDAKSNLPLRINATFAEEHRDRVLAIEVTYDYERIPVEKFSLVVPPGYTKLPRARAHLFSGKIVDEAGNPVADAEICTSDEDIRGRTDAKGEFAIRLHPERHVTSLPMIVRAFRSDDPNRVAWTLLRNPKEEPRPAKIPDDGKTKLVDSSGVCVEFVDERDLSEFVPGDPGKMVFGNEIDRWPESITDIVLEMEPADVVAGRITDSAGLPIRNAIVSIERMEVAAGTSEIDIRCLNHTATQRESLSYMDREDIEEIEGRAFAITDADGRYLLGNLPDQWYRARLEVKAQGHVSASRTISRAKQGDFSLFGADLTIGGTVIDNHGLPLVGREVGIDVESDYEQGFEVEETITDSQGRFELTGVPAVDGLELQIRTDEKPYDWDENELTRNRKFIYYRMIEHPIRLDPGKKIYSVEIVPHRPDITLEIEVKDSDGKLLEGVPVGICSSGHTERVWFTRKLNGRTNKNGICTIEEVPRLAPLRVWICKPEQMSLWRLDDEVNLSVKNAITEFASKYHPIETTVELEEGKKTYRVPAVLDAMGQ